MQYRHLAKRFLSPLVMTAAFAGSAQASLVSNGGFETADFSGWTQTHATVGSLSSVDDANPRTGDYAANFAGRGGRQDLISQALGTTANVGYTVSFWVDTEFGSDDGGLWAYINGQQMAATSYLPASGYANYTFDFFADTSATTLAFGGYTRNGYIDLDDIRVETNGLIRQPTQVPEPAGLLLVGVALAGASLGARGKRRN